MIPALIEGNYLKDILAQPDALHAAIAGLSHADVNEPAAGLRSGRFKRVVLTGMGSSFHALYPLHLELWRHGISAHHIETSELLLGFEPLFDAGTLLIVVSQSGESAEIVRLLQGVGEFGHTIAITNMESSRLSRGAATRLFLRAGVEATVSCKTYLNTLAVLHWLGAMLMGNEADPARALRELEEVRQAVQAYLSPWRGHVNALTRRLAGVRSVFVVGRESSLATAGTAGLTLKESTRQHAEGMSSASFRHGPMEMVDDKVFVLVLEGGARVAGFHHRLVDDVRAAGGRVALAGPGVDESCFRLPQVPAPVRPLVEILPVQMISLAIAALAGREAGRFERATKVTVIE